jgi:3-oxoacyl-[acyl-carrier protein] reductase
MGVVMSDAGHDPRGSGQVALVTGAGRGIGKATARTLAARGDAVAVNDLRGEAAEAVAASITAAGGVAIAVPGDVSDPQAVAAMLDATRDALGDPEILVNNAGFSQSAPLVDLTLDEFDRMIAVHLRGTFLCIHGVLPAMLAQQRGRIVNIASQLGQIGGPGLTHYSAAKAGIIGMTKALAREVSAQGVLVNAVAPGPVETDMIRRHTEEWRTERLKELPLRRFGRPQEIADAVAFLSSDAATLFVGQTLGPNSGDVML